MSTITLSGSATTLSSSTTTTTATSHFKDAVVMGRFYIYDPETDRLIPKSSFTIREFFERYEIIPKGDVYNHWLVVFNKKDKKYLLEYNPKTKRTSRKRFSSTNEILELLVDTGKI